MSAERRGSNTIAINWRGLLLLAGLAGIWELVPRVGLVDAVLLPPFTQVIGRLGSLLLSGSLWPHIGASVWRVLLGYGLALLVALPVGLYIGLREQAEKWLGPLTQLLRPLAPPAWIPLAILWFGIGNTPAVFIIFVGTVLTLLLGTIGAVRDVDKHLVQGALTLGATRTQAVFQVVLPAALPELLTMLRLGLGLAWMCVVAAEMVAVSRGLGFLILEARNTFNTTTVLAGMIAIGLLGLGMDVGLRQLQRRLLRWQAGRKAYGVLGDPRAEQGLSGLA